MKGERGAGHWKINTRKYQTVRRNKYLYPGGEVQVLVEVVPCGEGQEVEPGGEGQDVASCGEGRS